LPYTHWTAVKVVDVFEAAAFLRRKLIASARATSLLTTVYYQPWPGTCDLLHLINAINYSGGRWVVSFEHYLPRWDTTSRSGMHRLAGDGCKRILAWSGFALRKQESVLERLPDLSDVVRRKMMVVHPAEVPTLREYAEKKAPGDRISIAFVGRDFFRKGGLETLRAFKRVRARHRDIHLTIVSSFDFGDYASQSSVSDVAEARRLCEAMGGAVTVHPELPNREVLDLFARSHAALLPTYDDTFGFSVLEAQGAGCPVSTTDVGALPEINNTSVGWVVPVPKNELGVAHLKSAEERKSLSTIIEDGVAAAIEEICENASTAETRGRNALDRVARDHSPSSRARILEGIYDEALGGSG
jgi:glycosyltransferase involved in cell wall biosynthesis